MLSYDELGAKIFPDAELSVAENGKNLRLGVILRDRQDRKWGITAGHALGELAEATILTKDNKLLGKYRRSENIISAFEDSSDGLIARFLIEDNCIAADNISFRATWPHSIINREELLGVNAISTKTYDQQIGTIFEVDSVTAINFPSQSGPVIVKGAALLRLDDSKILPADGAAGTLILSERGEVAGIAIAMLVAQNITYLVLCPLSSYAEKLEAVIWVPPGAHWSDLDRRVKNFLRATEKWRKLDLGSIPSSGLSRRAV